jgi:hypothetical protein
MSSIPINRGPPPLRGAPGVGASRSLTLAPCFPAFGGLDVLILSRSEAMDSSSGVHDGEDCADVGLFLVDRLATGSSRRSDGGTCGLATGPITTDAGGVGSWTGWTNGVRDSGRPWSAIDKGSHDEMEGRRVLGAGGMDGRIDCEEERRFMGLSAITSAEELESYSSLGGIASCLRFG